MKLPDLKHSSYQSLIPEDSYGDEKVSIEYDGEAQTLEGVPLAKLRVDDLFTTAVAWLTADELRTLADMLKTATHTLDCKGC